jgi:hypothetical protein
MPENYILLERTELNASAASVTFANIPQSGYTDLKIVCSIRPSALDDLYIKFNGSSASFTGRSLRGNGASATSDTGAYWAIPQTATANTFASVDFYIPNYLSSNNKSFSVDAVSENNATTAYMNLSAGLWSNTAAITSIEIYMTTASLAAGSTFSLYGIAAVGTTPTIAPKASGGNRIDNDGTYWYHTFTSSGAFVPQVALSCDVLVVAGGGGGGAWTGGGGGAGGLRYLTSQSVTAINYAVTIGAGGAGGNAATAKGINGSNSSFNSTNASGGGAGAGYNGTYSVANTGGSGGGGTTGTGFTTGAAGNAGSYSPVEGYAGGAAIAAPHYNGGGGGGAGAVGGNAGTTTSAGAGGAGAQYSAFATATGTGISGHYAGGGGGGGYSGTGGSATHGGGAGGNDGASGVAGTTNTGGGGGASGNGIQTNNGNGGSGIVIIRYPIAS